MSKASTANDDRSTRPEPSDSGDGAGGERSGADTPAQAGSDSASEAARVMKQTSKTAAESGERK